jgi:hypothetical protein
MAELFRKSTPQFYNCSTSLLDKGTLAISRSPGSIHSTNQLMKYFLATILAFSCLPVNLSASVAAPSRCSAVLAQTQSALNKFHSFKIFKIDEKNEGISPPGRSEHFVFVRGLRTPVKEVAIAKKIITSCPKVGSVSFITNGTDEEDRYGLLNGKVQSFQCKAPEETAVWGKYGCS